MISLIESRWAGGTRCLQFRNTRDIGFHPPPVKRVSRKQYTKLRVVVEAVKQVCSVCGYLGYTISMLYAVCLNHMNHTTWRCPAQAAILPEEPHHSGATRLRCTLCTLCVSSPSFVLLSQCNPGGPSTGWADRLVFPLPRDLALTSTKSQISTSPTIPLI